MNNTTSRRLIVAAVSALIGLGVIGLTLASADDGLLPDALAKAFHDQKMATEQRLEDAARQARLAPQPPKNPDRGRGVVIATPAPWPTGIFESSNAPLRAADYKIVNQWQGIVGANYVQVYAGSVASDPNDGVLVVVVTSRDDLGKVSGATVRPPVRAGPLRISSAQGTQLTVTTAVGVFVFDAALGTFAP